jgi:hypothetical protein
MELTTSWKEEVIQNCRMFPRNINPGWNRDHYRLFVMNKNGNCSALFGSESRLNLGRSFTACTACPKNARRIATVESSPLHKLQASRRDAIVYPSLCRP